MIITIKNNPHGGYILSKDVIDGPTLHSSVEYPKNRKDLFERLERML